MSAPTKRAGDGVDIVGVFDGTRTWNAAGVIYKHDPGPTDLVKMRDKQAKIVAQSRARSGIHGPATSSLLRQISVCVRSRTAIDSPIVSFQVGAGPIRPAITVWPFPSRGKRAWYVVGEANNREDAARVRVGVADGPWHTVGTVVRNKSGEDVKTGQWFLKVVRPWQFAVRAGVSRAAVIAEVVYPADSSSHVYRVQAIDRTGHTMNSSGFKTNPDQSIEAWFNGNYDSIGRLELQERSLTWNTFPKVRLTPVTR